MLHNPNSPDDMIKTLLKTCFLISLFSLVQLASASESDPLHGAKRVVFLGDSITHGGDYIYYLEAALRATHPRTEFINLGLPSEGCTGLSEPDHPFPRPNIHERLDRALTKADPDVVFACYGMNDGIYYPFSEQRFAKYQAGMNRLIEKVQRHGAKLILMTPPPFDPLPKRKEGKLLPINAPEFSYKQVYEYYDRDVIEPYGEWILEQKDRVAKVIDLHKPLKTYTENQRKITPDFVLAPDGVHPNKTGHLILAQTIYQALYGKPMPDPDETEVALVGSKQAIMHKAWLTHVGHRRPGVNDGLPLAEARAKAEAIH
jgi:lysophospholipase L1-like esterase